MNVSQGLLPFQLIEDKGKIMMTSFGGIPLVMETFRALGLRASIQRHLLLLQRPGKYEEADYVESFVSVLCAGGDCVDDFELLRGDEGLGELGLRITYAPSILASSRKREQTSDDANGPGLGEGFPEEIIKDRRRRDERGVRAVEGYGDTRQGVGEYLGLHFTSVSRIVRHRNRMQRK